METKNHGWNRQILKALKTAHNKTEKLQVKEKEKEKEKRKIDIESEE